MMIRKPTCREAARLLFGTLEHKLSDAEREGLAAHLAECLACERVQAQVDFMQRAEAAWKRYGGDNNEDGGKA